MLRTISTLFLVLTSLNTALFTLVLVWILLNRMGQLREKTDTYLKQPVLSCFQIMCLNIFGERPFSLPHTSLIECLAESSTFKPLVMFFSKYNRNSRLSHPIYPSKSLGVLPLFIFIHLTVQNLILDHSNAFSQVTPQTKKGTSAILLSLGKCIIPLMLHSLKINLFSPNPKFKGRT